MSDDIRWEPLATGGYWRETGARYDRRGYARSGGEPVRSMSLHAADAATMLEDLQTQPAVVVGTSAGAAIAIDVAVRRPDLVLAVLAMSSLGGSLDTFLRLRRSPHWPRWDG